VTLLCFSRAPIERLATYKRRMGWQFPYVSTYNSDFAFDFGLALTEEQAQQIPEVKQMIDNPPEWLQDWSHPDRGRTQRRPAREPELDRLRARERDRLPHLHRVGARPVRRAVLQLPARANAEVSTRRAPQLAEGRISGLTMPPGGGAICCLPQSMGATLFGWPVPGRQHGQPLEMSNVPQASRHA
jgi:Bacterial protein of unknown function (DUF899)